MSSLAERALATGTEQRRRDLEGGRGDRTRSGDRRGRGARGAPPPQRGAGPAAAAPGAGQPPQQQID
eukprot:8921103-Pyramimonas_sp.AAC.1